LLSVATTSHSTNISRFVPQRRHQQPISRPSNAIRLTTITKTDKGREGDESSSTHQLADSENGQLDDYVHDEVPIGVHTIISSKTNDWRSLGKEEERDLTSIHVQKETVIEVKGV
jgi:hypothetical protein